MSRAWMRRRLRFPTIAGQRTKAVGNAPRPSSVQWTGPTPRAIGIDDGTPDSGAPGQLRPHRTARIEWTSVQRAIPSFSRRTIRLMSSGSGGPPSITRLGRRAFPIVITGAGLGRSRMLDFPGLMSPSSSSVSASKSTTSIAGLTAQLPPGESELPDSKDLPRRT